MNIIEAENVDLIEPFPTSECRRVFSWLHAYKNIVETDLSAKTPEEFAEFLGGMVNSPGIRSFGVIDKFNQVGFKHEAPLVGMIVYEPASPWNAYCHVASTRRAWGKGFIDEAIRTTIGQLFGDTPNLLRISALVLSTNGPVKGLVRRLGARYEGCMKDMVLQGGEPRDLLHFGITRKMWLPDPEPEIVAVQENSVP